MKQKFSVLLAVLLTSAAFPVGAMASAPPKTDASKATDDVLIPVRGDVASGKVLITLPAPDKDGVSGRFLYVTSLKTGVGSAPIGLDRALNGPTQILIFRRIGKKIAVEFENPRFRASDAPAAEQAAARDSFAYTTMWMGDIATTEADGRITLDISGFLTRDIIGISDALKQGGANGFRLNDALSAADPASIKSFPDNIEMEARQTYVSDTPGEEISNIAPDPRQISLIVRHSLIRLPEPGYVARRFDPRVGGFGSQAVDYGVPLGGDIVYDLANRFRLDKIDPGAARSKVKKPIIFYIDRAAPEPIRTALYEGTKWWADAFDKAGYIDAFQVQILPDDADPLDIRYNVVNWVNRATRGWSYGQVIADPRTGEIVKGSVLLGSLRVRQDMLIFEALVGADKINQGGPNDPVQVALARLRQLAAHEVGHALGLVHNFAASTQDRASVMDYPAPRIGLVGGKPDLSDAYGVGMGAWDNFAVDWLYGAPAPGTDDGAAARAKVDTALAKGIRFVSDADARSPDTAQPYGSLWDDNADPVAELRRMIDVRRAAIAQFGLAALKPGEPVANLRRKFVPVWLLHRYQVEAAAKLLGGVNYSYSVKGDGRETALPVDGAAQRGALAVLLQTLDPANLTVPDTLVPLLRAGVQGNYDRQYAIEVMGTAGGPVFDPLVAAETAATQTLNSLLAPSRLTRMADQYRADPTNLGVGEMLDRLIAATVTQRQGEQGRRIAYRVLLALAGAARDSSTAPGAAAMINDRLNQIAAQLRKAAGPGDDSAWARSTGRLLDDRETLDKLLGEPKKTVRVPPGMPIGADSDWMDNGDM